MYWAAYNAQKKREADAKAKKQAEASSAAESARLAQIEADKKKAEEERLAKIEEERKAKEESDKAYAQNRAEVAQQARDRRVGGQVKKIERSEDRASLFEVRPKSVAEKVAVQKYKQQVGQFYKEEAAAQSEYDKYWHIGKEALPKSDYEVIGSIESGNFTIQARPVQYKNYSDKHSKDKGYATYLPRVLEFKNGNLIKDVAYTINQTYNSKSRTEWAAQPNIVKDYGDYYVTESGFKGGDGYYEQYKQNYFDYEGNFLQGWNDLSAVQNAVILRRNKDANLEFADKLKNAKTEEEKAKIEKEKEEWANKNLNLRPDIDTWSKYNNEQKSASNFNKKVSGNGVKFTDMAGAVHYLPEYEAKKVNAGTFTSDELNKRYNTTLTLRNALGEQKLDVSTPQKRMFVSGNYTQPTRPNFNTNQQMRNIMGEVAQSPVGMEYFQEKARIAEEKRQQRMGMVGNMFNVKAQSYDNLTNSMVPRGNANIFAGTNVDVGKALFSTKPNPNSTVLPKGLNQKKNFNLTSKI